MVCALPLQHVSETMRPLPLESVQGMPDFLLGLSIIRGTPIPVVDLARLVGNGVPEAPARLVVVSVAERRVALAVQAVLDVRTLGPAALGKLPPLLTDASAEFIGAVGALDTQLLMVLNTAKILPGSIWAELESKSA